MDGGAQVIGYDDRLGLLVGKRRSLGSLSKQAAPCVKTEPTPLSGSPRRPKRFKRSMSGEK